MDAPNSAINKAIKVQATRMGYRYQDIAEAANMSTGQFSRRLNNKKDWTLSELDKVAKPLGLRDSFGIIDLAKQECD